MLKNELIKWWQTIKVTWSNQMAYKFNFALMIVAPALVFYVVKYNVWVSIFELNNKVEISGYTVRQMLNYQAWTMIVVLLGQSYLNSKVSEDIRLGRISAFLLYPFEFWKFHSGSFLGFQLTQLGVSFFTILTLWAFGLVEWSNWLSVIQGIIIAIQVGFLWFVLLFSIALLAFWIEETWVLRVMLVTIAQFLSGSLIPIDLYPEWLQQVLAYTPFPYLTYVPIKIFMNQYSPGFLFATLIISSWTILAFILLKVLWSRGVRLYTAAGI